MGEAYLYAGVRTPFGRYAGTLAASRPDDLAALVVREVVDRAPGLDPADVDDVILAWAAVLPELPVATRSAVQEAQPLWVEGDVVTFGVSPRLIEAAKPRFRREADTIRNALSQRVGHSLRFNLIAHDGFVGERASSAPSSAAPAPDPKDAIEAEPVEIEPGVGSATNPATFLTESLGATVVEERHHD